MDERVMINRINVTGLFDKYNHELKFDTDDNVSIMIGHNGIGKTTIFGILSFIFMPNQENLRHIISTKFKTFECDLTNGLSIKLTKKENSTVKENEEEKEEDDENQWKEFEYPEDFEDDKLVYDFWKSGSDIEIDVTGDQTFKLIQSAKISNGLFEDKRVFEFSHRRRYGVNHDNSVESDLSRKILNQYNKKFSYILLMLPMQYIPANRLSILNWKNFRDEFLHGVYNGGFSINESPFESCNLIMLEISNLIKKANEKYRVLLAEAKDKLPKLFLKSQKDNSDTYESFIGKWNEYQNELTKLKEIGLLTESDNEFADINIERKYQTEKKFLDVYLEVFKDTVDPFRDLYKKIALLKQILDIRNYETNKKLLVNENGFIMSMDNKEIPLKVLSSGEMNDFIMFYDLIFKQKENGLVMIDEPEISLHLKWQLGYLEELIRICDINNCQALVATHSPSIVGSNRELLASWRSYEF